MAEDVSAALPNPIQSLLKVHSVFHSVRSQLRYPLDGTVRRKKGATCIFVPGNGSPTDTNVVVVLEFLLLSDFQSTKIFRFSADRN